MSGNEALPTCTGDTILNMTQILPEEIVNIRRVFVLYATLPKEYYPDIEKCERDYESNRELYNKLLNLRWSMKHKN